VADCQEPGLNPDRLPFVPDNGGPVQMKVAVLSLALVGAHITTPASGRMPELNVDALCKADPQTLNS